MREAQHCSFRAACGEQPVDWHYEDSPQRHIDTLGAFLSKLSWAAALLRRIYRNGDLQIGQTASPPIRSGFCHFLFTSLLTKVRVFSDVFRHRKTKAADFTSLFLNNYRLKHYIIQAHTIKETRVSLEGFETHF
jgi:hypothetical protein